MKRIFIGSSSEALPYAHQIQNLLKAHGGVEPLLWTEVFDPGSLTFEGIEQVARKKISGAVLLATPDDESVTVVCPPRFLVPNVMIEFGYLAARIGRRNIALCRYDGVELASDLKGFTYIGMGGYAGSHGTRVIEAAAAQQVLIWADGLPDLLGDYPFKEHFTWVYRQMEGEEPVSTVEVPERYTP